MGEVEQQAQRVISMAGQLHGKAFLGAAQSWHKLRREF
jgi:hypothetical protein